MPIYYVIISQYGHENFILKNAGMYFIYRDIGLNYKLLSDEMILRFSKMYKFKI